MRTGIDKGWEVSGTQLGLLNGKIAATPLDKVVANQKPLDLRLLELAGALAK